MAAERAPENSRVSPVENRCEARPRNSCEAEQKNNTKLIAFFCGTYCITVRRTSTCARVAVCGTSRDVQRWSFGPLGEVSPSMIKKRTDSAAAKCRPSGSDAASRLQSVNQYLEKNFPDFFAEARFQVGDDDNILYARIGQFLF